MKDCWIVHPGSDFHWKINIDLSTYEAKLSDKIQAGLFD